MPVVVFEKQSMAVVEGRRQWVLENYLKGRLPKDIWVDYQQKYQLSKKSYEADVTVMYQWLEESNETSDQLISKHSRLYYELYNQCIQNGDTSDAMKALARIERLKLPHGNHKGVAAGSVTINQQNNVNLPSMTVDEIKQLLGR